MAACPLPKWGTVGLHPIVFQDAPSPGCFQRHIRARVSEDRAGERRKRDQEDGPRSGDTKNPLSPLE